MLCVLSKLLGTKVILLRFSLHEKFVVKHVFLCYHFLHHVLNRRGRDALVLQCNRLKYAGKCVTLEGVAVVFKASVFNVLSALERSK